MKNSIKYSRIVFLDDKFYDELEAADEGLHSLIPKKMGSKDQRNRLFTEAKRHYPEVVSPDALDGFEFNSLPFPSLPPIAPS